MSDLMNEIEALRERLDALEEQAEAQAAAEEEAEYEEEFEDDEEVDEVDVTPEELEALRRVAAAASNIRDLSNGLKNSVGVGIGLAGNDLSSLANLGPAVSGLVAKLQEGMTAAQELDDALNDLADLTD